MDGVGWVAWDGWRGMAWVGGGGYVSGCGLIGGGFEIEGEGLPVTG